MAYDPRKISGMAPARSLEGTEWIEVLQAGENRRAQVRELKGEIGPAGLSAYELARTRGFEGSLSEWLASLEGEDGQPGDRGPRGAEGLSAYEVAVAEGYNGTVGQWLASLRGLHGESAYQTAVRVLGFQGTETDFLASLVGRKGDQGDRGDAGPRGVSGLSAYELAVLGGYQGTLVQWLVSLQGAAGASAYQLAVQGGYSGSVQEWLTSLQGASGSDAYTIAVQQGFQGTRQQWLQSLVGRPGDRGEAGTDGKDAYEVAVDTGFQGTRQEWVASLIGERGPDGRDAYQLATAAGFQGTREQWLSSLIGPAGPDGKSAYDLAVENGFVGSRSNWLDSLQGAPGQSAYQLAVNSGYQGTLQQWLQSLVGVRGTDGFSAYQLAVSQGFQGTLTQWLDSLKGRDGRDGKSTYDIAVYYGYTGTESEWIALQQRILPDAPDTDLYLRTRNEWVASGARRDQATGSIVYDSGYMGGAPVSHLDTSLQRYDLNGFTFTLPEPTPPVDVSVVLKTHASDPVGWSYFGKGLSVSGDGQTALVGAYQRSVVNPITGDSLSGCGVAYFFRREGDGWVEDTRVTPLLAAGSWVGHSVALNYAGTVAFISSHTAFNGDNNGAGVVFVYRKNGEGQWAEEARLRPSDPQAFANFGWSLATDDSGNLLAVGAVGGGYEYNGAGAVYIFRKDEETGDWLEDIKLTDPQGSYGDKFGEAIAVSGNGSHIAVGAPQSRAGHSSGNYGAVLLYRMRSGEWQLAHTFTDPEGQFNDFFGTSVALSQQGQILLIGAHQADIGGVTDAGAVFHYADSTSEWYFVEKLTHPEPSMYANFGMSVSIADNGDTLFVGATRGTGADADHGAIYRYHLGSEGNRVTTTFTSPNPTGNEKLGRSLGVSRNGRTLLSGDPEDNTHGGASGAFWTFFNLNLS